MLKKSAFLLYSLAVGLLCQAQIDRQETPLAWSEFAPELPNVIYNTSPEPNVSSLMAEDFLLDSDRQNDYRFAASLPFNLTTHNSGRWTSLPGGSRLWQLGIRLENALSLNVYLSELQLPPGSKLFIYSPDHDHFLGDFVGMVGESFASTPLEGFRLIIEFYEPAEFSGQGHIKLERVGYGYRSVDATGHLFGHASDCSIPSDGTNQLVSNAQASTVLVLTDFGTRLRTGIMVNNSGNEVLPYLLTSAVANSEDVAGWTFVFNRSIAGSKESEIIQVGQQSVYGADLLKSYDDHNIALLKLTKVPKSEWNVYYSGWQLTEPNGSVFNTHFPKGDIGTQANSDFAAPQISHKLAVREWASGLTEQGSIGSPLFNSAGQLCGIFCSGSSSCENNGTDIFTRPAAAWNGPDGLKKWLDPKNHNQIGLDGRPAEESEIIISHINEVTVIYPNPTSGRVFHQIKKGFELTGIALMDSHGRELDLIEIDENQLTLEHLEPGVYLLRLWIGDLPETHRIIVSR